MNVLRCCSGLLLSLALVLSAQADSPQRFGQYEVHYSAFNSSFLEPEVAEAYNIQRSKYQGLVNVSVLEEQNGGTEPVTAVVTGHMTNLLGQQQELKFKQVREGNAIYYLTNFHFSDGDPLKFNISVQPDPNEPPHQVNFQQKFYTD